MDIVATLSKQGEEKPLKLAVIELAERCRELEKENNKLKSELAEARLGK